MLYVRLGEVQALAALEGVSKTDVFISAAGNSVLDIGKTLGKAVADPKATVGARRRGQAGRGNLGRKAKKTAETATEAVKGADRRATKPKADTAGEKSTSKKAVDTGTSAAKSYLGVSGRHAAGPETGRGPVLLERRAARVARGDREIDAAGGIAAKAVVPIPPVVSKAADVSDLVWGKDPEELPKLNKQRLAELGVDKAFAAEFLESKAFSPSQQTRFVAALHAVRAAGLADYVDAAREAGARSRRNSYRERQMLATFHAGDPVKAVLTDSRAMVAVAGGKKAVALLPLDSVRWTEASKKALTEIADRARKELSAGSLRHRSDRPDVPAGAQGG